MSDFSRYCSQVGAVAAALVLGLPGVRGASLYMSVVAETFGPEAARFVAGEGKPVTYAAMSGGFIDSGDPMGGVNPPPAAVLDSAVAQSLARRGYQPAAPGTTPALLIVYNWGEIRRDSFQVPPPDRLKGNDRARLMLVSRSRDAERIEQSLVNDRYTRMNVGAMTLTERDRDALQLAADEIAFVVVSAYDLAALREARRTPVWQVKLTTRAVGQPLADSLVSLIHHGTPYLGRDEATRKTLKEEVVAASGVQVLSAPALNKLPAGVDSQLVRNIVESEHAMWSGKFAKD